MTGEMQTKPSEQVQAQQPVICIRCRSNAWALAMHGQMASAKCTECDFELVHHIKPVAVTFTMSEKDSITVQTAWGPSSAQMMAQHTGGTEVDASGTDEQ